MQFVFGYRWDGGIGGRGHCVGIQCNNGGIGALLACCGSELCSPWAAILAGVVCAAVGRVAGGRAARQ